MSNTGFDKILRGLGPAMAMAAMNGVMAAAKKDGRLRFEWPGEGEPGAAFGALAGVPLAELAMDGPAPNGLVLAGADRVQVVAGDDFAIAVQGSDAAQHALRFRLKDGVLHIASQSIAHGHGGEDSATITITMPPVCRATIAGSGAIVLDALADDAELLVAGSGRIKARDVDLARLTVSIAGSGRCKISGAAEQLRLSVAGSGQARLGGLMVDTANVTMAGSGSARFACDGTVKARLMGSGQVTVRGAARCRVQGMGSGTLVVERSDGADTDPPGAGTAH